MAKSKSVLLSVALGLAWLGCGGGAEKTTDSTPSQFIAGFDVPPVEPGYTRYVTDTVSLQPGDDLQWCQYMAPAATEPLDIVGLSGAQSVGGHHLIVYATANQAPVGTQRFCNSDDMLNVRVLGGFGGEAQSNLGKELPPGVIFRIPQGYSLMFNYHYIDATPQAIQGQAYVDIKTGPPQPSDQVGSLFAVNNDQFTVLPISGIQTSDSTCVVQQDMQFFSVGNHMHAMGYSAYYELIHADGTHQMLRNDPTWSSEETFNPTVTLYPADQLLQIHVGETIHTHCEWVNTGTETLTFPTEMCVGFAGFLPGDGELLTCTDGLWNQ